MRFPNAAPALLALALALLASPPLRADGLRSAPAFSAADLAAPVVTAERLLASERFWPYRVELVGAWDAPDGTRLRIGARGVLVRVEEDGRARIDFGRDGVHEVPTGVTDLVARAERVRRGELEKILPNFVHAIGPRLVDPQASPPGPLPLTTALAQRGFVSVFAAPDDPRLAELGRALAPLGEIGVMTVFFPQGRHPDGRVLARLDALGWKVPFVRDHLSEGYTHAQLAAGTPLPAVMVHSPDGRKLFASAWTPDVAARARQAASAAFGEPTRTAATP